MSELKPCPFCNMRAAEPTTSREEEACHRYDDCEIVDCGMWLVVCDVHNGGCGASTGFFDSKKKAIDAWNRRGNECDRDALIELAENLEKDADRIVDAARNARFTGYGPRMDEAKHDAYEWRCIARSIRQACLENVVKHGD